MPSPTRILRSCISLAFFLLLLTSTFATSPAWADCAVDTPGPLFVHRLNACPILSGGVEPPYDSPDKALADIQDAVDYAGCLFAADASKTPRTVIVLPGLAAAVCGKATDYVENVVMKDGVRLVGVPGAVIDGDGEGPVITYSHPVGEEPEGSATVAGFLLTHGEAEVGGGVRVENATLYLVLNTIAENEATSTSLGGGGVYLGGSKSSFLVGNHVLDNVAEAGAGLYLDLDLGVSSVVVENRFAGNTADERGGGGIFVDGQSEALIERNRIESNSTSSSDGGGMRVSGGTPAVWIGGNEIRFNTALEGGGLAVAGIGSPTLVRNEFELNLAGKGGGIHVSGSGALPSLGLDTSADGVNFFGNLIRSNTAIVAGGGIGVESCATPTISSNQIVSNSAGVPPPPPGPGPPPPAPPGGMGGGVWWEGTTCSIPGGSITANEIFLNKADLGGGVALIGTEIPVILGRMEKNRADSLGGGLYLVGTTTAVSEVKFINNFSSDAGGGLAASFGSTVDVTGSVFRQNLAVERGGGLHVSGSGTALDLGSVASRNLLENNAALSGGAASVVGDSSLLAINNDVLHNLASVSLGFGIVPVGAGAGGGFYAEGSGTLLTLGTGAGALAFEENYFHDNIAEAGGAVAGADSATLWARNNTFSFNVADLDADGLGHGGAIHATGMGTVLTVGGDGTFDTNLFLFNAAGTPDPAPRAGFGGAIAVDDLAETEIIKNEFEGNAVSANGGAIWFHHLEDALVRGSVTSDNGCGVKEGPPFPCVVFGAQQWSCPEPMACDLSMLGEPAAEGIEWEDSSGDPFLYDSGSGFEEVVTAWPDGVPFPPEGFVPGSTTMFEMPFSCDPYPSPAIGGVPGDTTSTIPMKTRDPDEPPDLVTLNGGFLAVEDSSGIAYENSIVTSFAELAGGGVWVGNTKPAHEVLIGLAGLPNLIHENHAAWGGGVGIVGSASATVYYNEIGDLLDANLGNQADEGGGGVWIDDSSPLVSFNVIAQNRAGRPESETGNHGGGVGALESDGEVFCNWIIGNFASGKGGGASIDSSGPEITFDHNTFSQNDALERGGGVYGSGPLTLSNNIVDHFGCYDSHAVYLAECATVTANNVWNNTGRTYGGVFEDLTGVSANLSANPLFIDPPAGDFSLAGNSPSRSAGGGTGCADPNAQGWNRYPTGAVITADEILVPGEHATLTAALAVASYGDRITVSPGVYSLSETFPLVIPDGVVLQSIAVAPAGDLEDISNTRIEAFGSSVAVEITPGAGKRTAFGGFTIEGAGSSIDTSGFNGYLFAHALLPTSGPGILLDDSPAFVEHVTVVPPESEFGISGELEGEAPLFCQGVPAGPYFSHNISSLSINKPETETEPVLRDIFLFVNDHYPDPEGCAGDLIATCPVRGNITEDPDFLDLSIPDLHLSDADSPAWASHTLDRRWMGVLPVPPRDPRDVVGLMRLVAGHGGSGDTLAVQLLEPRGAPSNSFSVTVALPIGESIDEVELLTLLDGETPQSMSSLDLDGNGKEELTFLTHDESLVQSILFIVPPKLRGVVRPAGGPPETPTAAQIGRVTDIGTFGSDGEVIAVVSLDHDSDSLEDLGLLRRQSGGVQSFHVNTIERDQGTGDLTLEERASYSALGTLGASDEVLFVSSIHRKSGERPVLAVGYVDLSGSQSLRLYPMPSCRDEDLPAVPLAGIDDLGTAGEAGEVLGMTGLDREGSGGDNLALLISDGSGQAHVSLHPLPASPGEGLGEVISRTIRSLPAETFLSVVGVRGLLEPRAAAGPSGGRGPRGSRTSPNP